MITNEEIRSRLVNLLSVAIEDGEKKIADMKKQLEKIQDECEHPTGVTLYCGRQTGTCLVCKKQFPSIFQIDATFSE